MRIGDYLYFAPDIRFDKVQLDSPEVVRQYQKRIEGYYLEPARMLASKGYGFGAVTILASALDALARFERPLTEKNRKRYISWTSKHVPSLTALDFARQFYDDFRCGVVHEGRAKAGCVFVPKTAYTIKVEGNLMGVNPEKFADEITQVLEDFCTRTESTPALLQHFQDQLKADFAKELPALTPTTTNPVGP